MTPPANKQMDDPDIHKGAIEGDRRPTSRTSSNKGKGVDKNGLPNDPVATAQDKEGANADKSQG